MKKINPIFYLLLVLSFGLIVGCEKDPEPMPMEEEEEEISQVILTFTPDNGEDAITATWLDADGEGSGAPTIDQIDLEEGVTYTMQVELTNTLGATPEDITAEIREEADEHMFFFSFTEGIFSDPTGNGNVDSRNDPLNYNDEDSNGMPIGLSTTWTAGGATSAVGELTIVLKHQPDGQKTSTSNATVGGTDVDVNFAISIQ